MRAVVLELIDQSGAKSMDLRYNANEVDAMSNLAWKQQARMVLSTGEPKFLKLADGVSLRFRLEGVKSDRKRII